MGYTMPSVVAVNFHPRSNLVSVTLDTSESFSLHAEIVLEKGVVNGNKLTKIQIKDYQALSFAKRMRTQAFSYIAIRQRSALELKRYLNKKLEKSLSIFRLVDAKTGENLITEVIDDLIKRNYIDDEAFAKNYIASRMSGKGKGKRALLFELTQKGVAKSTIARLFQDETLVSQDKTNTLIDKSIEKTALVIRSRSLDKRKAREMMTRRLLGRGFSFDEIRSKIDYWLHDEYNR
jgi:regulatory protein